jgi:hypothetical protein
VLLFPVVIKVLKPQKGCLDFRCPKHREQALLLIAWRPHVVCLMSGGQVNRQK